MPERVVADSSPIRYLVLIGHAEILSLLFEQVTIPAAVRDELVQDQTPQAVRAWMETPPAWLKIRPQPPPPDESLRHLDPGERAVIGLGTEINADLLLMDDRAGVRTARDRGFPVVGTLRLLDLASRRSFVNWEEAIVRLSKTNFRYKPEILEALRRERQSDEGRS